MSNIVTINNIQKDYFIKQDLENSTAYLKNILT